MEKSIAARQPSAKNVLNTCLLTSRVRFIPLWLFYMRKLKGNGGLDNISSGSWHILWLLKSQMLQFYRLLMLILPLQKENINQGARDLAQ